MDEISEKMLKTFSDAMHDVMQKHYETKGSSWVNCNPLFLRDKLQEEINEYKEHVIMNFSAQAELIDIANVCAMIYFRYIIEYGEKKSTEFRKGE